MLLIFTARNEVGERLYFHRCLWFCPQGGWYPSMHCRWYPSMPCSRGVCYPSMPCSRGMLSQHALQQEGCLLPGGVCSRGVPCLGGFAQRVPGGDPQDGHCCGWYASYWNAFLSSIGFPHVENRKGKESSNEVQIMSEMKRSCFSYFVLD